MRPNGRPAGPARGAVGGTGRSAPAAGVTVNMPGGAHAAMAAYAMTVSRNTVDKLGVVNPTNKEWKNQYFFKYDVWTLARSTR